KGRRKRLERLPRLSPPPGEAGAMNLVLEVGERGGDRVVQAEKVKIAVGERTLIDNMSLTMMRGDVVALIGPNGAGKTTLLSTLLGAREPQAGELRVGGSITPAWYRQDLAALAMFLRRSSSAASHSTNGPGKSSTLPSRMVHTRVANSRK